MTSYYKLTGIPNSILLFEAVFDEGMSASLIGLNGTQSKIYPLGSKAVVIDGNDYSDYILVIGSDATDAAAVYAFSALDENQMAALYPNPLSIGNSINLSYVLLEDNQSGHIAIYDINGRKVYSNQMADDLLSSGLHELNFIPPVLSSGVYIVALQFDDTVIADKFTYLK